MKELIWDIPTRVLHWALAISIVTNLFLLEGGEDPHRYLGYFACALVGIRFFWGFKGGVYSRFKNFSFHPRNIFKETKGHNTLASWAYISLWTLVLALGITGWMMQLDAFWGDERLEEIHEVLGTGTQIYIAIHLLGMSTDSFRKRSNSFLSMFTGKK